MVVYGIRYLASEKLPGLSADSQKPQLPHTKSAVRHLGRKRGSIPDSRGMEKLGSAWEEFQIIA